MSLNDLTHKALLANSIPLKMKHWDVVQMQKQSQERLACLKAVAMNIDSTYRKLEAQ